MRVRHLVCRGVLTLVTLANGPVHAAVLDSAAVARVTVDAIPVCLRWQPIGICLWLDCSPSGCTVRTSIKVENYVPDAYVNVTMENQGSFDASGSIEGRREQGNPRRGRDRQTFREADLYGHPLSAVVFAGASRITSGLQCLPRSVPNFPYFTSSADAAVWRSIVPIESLYPAALVPGLREIGTFPLNTWGPVHPRIGRVVQQEEPKVGAVLAQRAGDIVTRLFQPHVYVPIDQVKLPDAGMKYWDPGPLYEVDATTGDWQMLYPVLDPGCAVFGWNDALALASWSDGRKSDDGAYQFNLWRPYQCCEVKGIYIGSIGGRQ
jgi:integrating conjugative element protein (TIGR03756 family)